MPLGYAETSSSSVICMVIAGLQSASAYTPAERQHPWCVKDGVCSFEHYCDLLAIWIASVAAEE